MAKGKAPNFKFRDPYKGHGTNVNAPQAPDKLRLPNAPTANVAEAFGVSKAMGKPKSKSK